MPQLSIESIASIKERISNLKQYGERLWGDSWKELTSSSFHLHHLAEGFELRMLQDDISDDTPYYSLAIRPYSRVELPLHLSNQCQAAISSKCLVKELNHIFDRLIAANNRNDANAVNTCSFYFCRTLNEGYEKMGEYSRPGVCHSILINIASALNWILETFLQCFGVEKQHGLNNVDNNNNNSIADFTAEAQRSSASPSFFATTRQKLVARIHEEFNELPTMEQPTHTSYASPS